MKRPKENRYACMTSGCIGEPCHACEVSELWEYIRHLERSDNNDYAKCSKEIIEQWKWAGDMREDDIIEVLKKHFA